MTGEAVMNMRFTMIADILPVMDDKKALGKAITRTADEYGISKPTVRRYLKLYQENGKQGLLPRNRTQNKEKNLTDFERNIRWGLNKFYYTTAKRSLKSAYRMLLEAKYYKDGKLIEPYPSFWQFRYYYRTHNKVSNEIISRQGLSYYQRNERPLLGNGVQQFAGSVGTGMLDSTVCDIYLINETGQIVGRPILTACVDAFSGLCCGYSLGWEGGTYSLRKLMLNVISDKVEHCKKFGIQISDKEWNCKGMPAKLITDMGSEYASENFSQLTELGISITNLPPYRPELKGTVEKFFDVVQGYYKPYLKGKGVIESDYRRQACLTINDFEKVILHSIVYYNAKRILEDFPYTEAMLDEGVKPYASDVWQWGCHQSGANLLDIDCEMFSLTLLPRTAGKFGRKGLTVHKLRYVNRDYTEKYLTGQDAVIAYNPDDVSTVWLIEKGNYVPFRLIESRYENKNLEEIQKMEQKKRNLIRNEKEAELLAEVEMASHIMNIVSTATVNNRSEISG